MFNLSYLALCSVWQPQHCVPPGTLNTVSLLGASWLYPCLPRDPQHGNLSGIFNTVPQLGPSVIFNTVFRMGSSTRFFPGIPTWHPIYCFPSWYPIHWGSPRILNTMSHLRFSLKPGWEPQDAVSYLGYSTLCPSWYC
jgi:hypothetical protein